MENNFDRIRKEGRLLIEFIRGSQLYGLSTPDSDVDTGGVFICNPAESLGFLHYHSQESDERHDNTWYEVGEFCRLICKSNPTVLEALFVPEDKIIGEVHPWMKLLRDNRDKFITKECFNPFFGYAKSQIEKARGLKKKIVNPIEKRLTPLDFCYKTNDHGGSELLEEFLNSHGLKQEYCGVTALDHMHNIHNLYYDWGAHIKNEYNNLEEFRKDNKFRITCLSTLDKINEYKDCKYYCELEETIYKNEQEIGYRGIMDPDLGNELRLSGIPKNRMQCLCCFAYNASGYSDHCREYKEYKEWEKNRNPVRYSVNQQHNVDSKNMCHCFRLMHMAKEIAEGKGIILERTWDKEFLMDVRNHKFDYTELMKKLEEEKIEMEEAMKNSTIPEKIDPELVNNLLIQIRLEQIKGKANLNMIDNG